MCAREPRRREFAVLRGLYLGDVARADAKLASVLRSLRDAGLARRLITVVASDHGEHLGEHRMVFHDVGLREPLIRVPLVVHGLAGVEPAVIESPVQLADLVPSVLSWLGLPMPENLPGRPLPTAPGTATEVRAIVSHHSNGDPSSSPDREPSPTARFRQKTMRDWLVACGPEDRVFGEMRSLVRHPWKLMWYAEYPTQLYNLEYDPSEEHDLAEERPEIVAELMGALERTAEAAAPVARSPRPSEPLDPDLLERLRELGYVQ